MFYTDRSAEVLTVASVKEVIGHKGCPRVEILTTDSTGIRVPVNGMTSAIAPGDEILLETTNATVITALAFADDPERWMFRKTDDELRSEHEQEVAEINARYGWN